MAAENGHVGDCANEVECVEEDEGTREPKNYFNMSDVFNAIKNQQVADNIASLPPDVQRRLKALKRLQFQVIILFYSIFVFIIIYYYVFSVHRIRGQIFRRSSRVRMQIS